VTFASQHSRTTIRRLTESETIIFMNFAVAKCTKNYFITMFYICVYGFGTLLAFKVFIDFLRFYRVLAFVQ